MDSTIRTNSTLFSRGRGKNDCQNLAKYFGGHLSGAEAEESGKTIGALSNLEGVGGGGAVLLEAHEEPNKDGKPNEERNCALMKSPTKMESPTKNAIARLRGNT
uniref:Uncharacterized protein n=1 Tax=Oryza rufipogon TaxID=4529 RepID=A0A0E0PCZ8_ORYRU